MGVKISAKGLKLSYSSTAEGTFADIKNLGDTTLNFPEREFRDDTCHDSEGDFREFTPDLYGEGSVDTTVKLENPEHASHAAMYTAKDTAALTYFKATLPKVGTVFTFAAYVQKFGINGPVSGSLNVPFSLKISGKITKVPATP